MPRPKKGPNELDGAFYSHLYRLPTTGLRFLTVYGPWDGRIWRYFCLPRRIIEGTRFQSSFNHCKHAPRLLLYRMTCGCPHYGSSITFPGRRGGGRSAPARIYNVGNNSPEELMAMYLSRFWRKNWCREASKQMCRCKPVRCPETYADIVDLTRERRLQATDFNSQDGIRDFVAWISRPL